MDNDESVVVPREELNDTWQFQASLSNHPIVRFPDGHLRYKKTISDADDKVDMNELWREYRNGKHTREWMMQYYRDIGYSLGGYEEIWGGEMFDMQRKITFERDIDEIEYIWNTTDLKSGLLTLAKVITEIDTLCDMEERQVLDLIELLRLAARRISF